MSYILDALKKSEQERGHGAAPGIQTTHSSSLNYYSGKTPWWPYALVFVITINLAALLYFVMIKDNSLGKNTTTAAVHPAAEQVKPEPAVALSPATEIKTGRQQNQAIPTVQAAAIAPMPAQSKPVTQQADIPAPATSDSQPAALSDATIDREELPYDIQQHIPIMEFSAHVYSSNPMQRSIVINGRFMEEGDNLGSDLVLNEITPQGAVFDFQGYRFHQGVVSSWN